MKSLVGGQATRPYRMRARQEAVEETRERILAAAHGLWMVRPYDQVTIGAVAEAAGVSRQTVIRQFGTKDELAFAVVDWQKPHEDAVRAAEPGDVGGAIARLVERYETMGDANVRVLELEGRVPAIDYLLEVSRAGHRAWIERTLVPGVDDEQLVFALYAATDVTLWKLLRRDLGRSQADTEAVVLRLVRGALGEASDRKEQHP
jgi:AcrR family transcriptional regulator